MIVELDASSAWNSPIVTEVVAAQEFYPAEPIHQGYFDAHPGQGYCAVVINPKVAALRRNFTSLLKGSH